MISFKSLYSRHYGINGLKIICIREIVSHRGNEIPAFHPSVFMLNICPGSVLDSENRAFG